MIGEQERPSVTDAPPLRDAPDFERDIAERKLHAALAQHRALVVAHRLDAQRTRFAVEPGLHRQRRPVPDFDPGAHVGLGVSAIGVVLATAVFSRADRLDRAHAELVQLDLEAAAVTDPSRLLPRGGRDDRELHQFGAKLAREACEQRRGHGFASIVPGIGPLHGACHVLCSEFAAVRLRAHHRAVDGPERGEPLDVLVGPMMQRQVDRGLRLGAHQQPRRQRQGDPPSFHRRTPPRRGCGCKQLSLPSPRSRGIPLRAVVCSHSLVGAPWTHALRRACRSSNLLCRLLGVARLAPRPREALDRRHDPGTAQGPPHPGPAHRRLRALQALEKLAAG